MNPRQALFLAVFLSFFSNIVLGASEEEANQAYDDLVNSGADIVANITVNVDLLRNLTNDFLTEETETLTELITTEMDKIQNSVDQVAENDPDNEDLSVCTNTASGVIANLRTELIRRVDECKGESVVAFGYSVDQAFSRLGGKYGDYISCAHRHVTSCTEIADADSCYDFAIKTIEEVGEKMTRELFFIQSHIANVGLGIESPCTDLLRPAVDVHKNIVLRNLDICSRTAVKQTFKPVCPSLSH